VTYRILVTGTRTWDDARRVYEELALAASEADGEVVVVHGYCPRGADLFADLWARKHAEPEPHPADWGRYGRRAGMIRNSEMAALGADVCLAFVGPCRAPGCRRPRPHDSHGTTDCVAKAMNAGIPVRVFRA